ncbi:MAG TPA: iron-containing alcohol dehydrogenase [Candidatus Limnocylindria bacterium]|nr:iron-containing alcohol dehydrogenase [Candidatus Limnocylindria bacterium]
MQQTATPMERLTTSFDFQSRTRIVFGVNAVERVGEIIREVGAKKVLLVTDPGIAAAGHEQHVLKSLAADGVSAVVFDKVRENPTTRCVDDCLSVARSAGIEAIVGLGGGSSMDTAKGCNFLLTNGGRMQDYWGVGKATKPMLPLIAIPTTAGTGSECQSAALIADEATHQKMACLDPKAAARVAILDPALTVSQPPRVTACTGIDAIAHAVETAVTKKRNPFSLMFSHEAFKLLVPNFSRVVENPNDLDARGKMLLGAAFAGTAIENSMLGAAHSTANPLTAHYGIVHGQAVGMMLPHVIRFNAVNETAKRGYAELASAPEIAWVSEGLDQAVDALVAEIQALLELAKMPASLSDCGVKQNDLPMLATEAAKQWTATFNPRAITEKDFLALFEAAF